MLTNDRLQKIILPPRFAHELSPAEDGKRAVWKTHDPEERLEVVLRTPDLDPDGLVDSLKRSHKPKSFDNALPAAIIAGVFGAPLSLIRSLNDNQEIKSLVMRFDPTRVRLGMTIPEVDGLYGQPLVTEKSTNGWDSRYYGSPKLGTQNTLLWVTVVFRGEQVVRVFSDDFFNYRKVK